MLKKVPGDIASQCWSILVAKSSHVMVDVDGYPAAYTVLQPTTVRGGGMASYQASSCPIVL
jgi:hypothetical protein